MAISKQLTFYAYAKPDTKIRFIISELDFINVLENRRIDVSDFLDDYSDRKSGNYLYKLCKESEIPIKIKVFRKRK